VLASGSPRRVDLLQKAGLEFRQFIPDIDETNSTDLQPHQLAEKLARDKAQAVAEKITEKEIILSGDTIVILQGRILGKPENKNDAFRMLTALSGNKHTVCTSVALCDNKKNCESGYELTDVYFKNTPAEAIRKYIDTGEPMDKAGAYGIQDRGVFLVDRVVGNIDNVIGLPLTLVDNLCRKLAEKKGLYEV